nr:MAG TPA: hypothetical protein [Bacteriophage sp.]
MLLLLSMKQELRFHHIVLLMLILYHTCYRYS